MRKIKIKIKHNGSTVKIENNYKHYTELQDFVLSTIQITIEKIKK